MFKNFILVILLCAVHYDTKQNMFTYLKGQLNVYIKVYPIVNVSINFNLIKVTVWKSIMFLVKKIVIKFSECKC